MATFRERVSKDGKKSISVRVWLKSCMKEPVYFTAPNMATARTVARDMEADITAGRLIPEEKKRTFGELVDAYLEEVLPLSDESDNWKRRKKTVLGRVKQDIGHLKLSEVRPHHIATYRRARLREGLEPSTVNREISIISSCFTEGRKELGWAKANPCTDVERSSEVGRERTRYLTNEQHQALMDACDEACADTLITPDDLRTIIDIALETGGRRSNVEWLRWPNVNLNWSAEGRDDDIGAVTFPDTKNDEGVTVPIAGSALNRLRDRYRQRVPRLDTDLVFPRKKDGKKPVYTRKAFDKALEIAGLNAGEGERFVFHNLRHTTGTWILENGGNTRDVMEHLGQRTETVARRYAKATAIHKVGVARRLAERKKAGAS